LLNPGGSFVFFTQSAVIIVIVMLLCNIDVAIPGMLLLGLFNLLGFLVRHGWLCNHLIRRGGQSWRRPMTSLLGLGNLVVCDNFKRW